MGWNPKINFDGAIAVNTLEGVAVSYTQVFRTGAIESVDAQILSRDADPIPSYTLEETSIEGLERNLQLADTLGVAPPIVVALSLR